MTMRYKGKGQGGNNVGTKTTESLGFCSYPKQRQNLLELSDVSKGPRQRPHIHRAGSALNSELHPVEAMLSYLRPRSTSFCSLHAHQGVQRATSFPLWLASLLLPLIGQNSGSNQDTLATPMLLPSTHCR